MTATRLQNRAVIRLSPTAAGEDVAGFLQGLLTNDVTGELPAYAALLSAQGKTMFDMIVWPGRTGEHGATILLDCEADVADDLVKRLSLYRLRRKIEIARDESLAVHWSAEPIDAHPPDPRLPALGHRWLAPASPDAGEGDAAAAFRAHRLSLGVFEGVEELGQDQVLWLETNAQELGGVDYDKGCYVGQENTARMHYRNKVSRRLVAVPLSEADDKRQRAALPDLGLSIELRRVEGLDPALLPDWLAAAIAGEAAV